MQERILLEEPAYRYFYLPDILEAMEISAKIELSYHPFNDNKYYYCPIKILQSHKIRADFICEVSPFSLDFSRQTIKSNYGQKYTF